jgi:hypothetical protein
MQVLSACLGRWCHLICLLDMALKTEFMHTNIRFFFKFLFIYLFFNIWNECLLLKEDYWNV